MKELIEFIAKSLVDHPEEVQVRESGSGSRVRIELSVSKDDMGRVIGKSGATYEHPLLAGVDAYGATELEARAKAKDQAPRKLEEIQGGASS